MLQLLAPGGSWGCHKKVEELKVWNENHYFSCIIEWNSVFCDCHRKSRLHFLISPSGWIGGLVSTTTGSGSLFRLPVIFSGLIGFTLLCLPRAQPGVFRKVVKSVDLFWEKKMQSIRSHLHNVQNLTTAPTLVGIVKIGITRMIPALWWWFLKYVVPDF